MHPLASLVLMPAAEQKNRGPWMGLKHLETTAWTPTLKNTHHPRSPMRTLSLFLAIGFLSILPAQGQDGLPYPDRYTLFAFDGADEARWGIVNDGVMGGLSRGFGEIEDGHVRFWGELVTRGGGFTSMRTRARLNLAGYDGLELRVRGNGRTFEVELSDGTRYRGRNVSRRAAFATSDEWTTVRVPFSSFRSSIFGQPVNAGPLDPSTIRAVGLYILDGKDGAFELEVDEIRVYRERRM